MIKSVLKGVKKVKRDALSNQLVKHEGIRLKPYRCQAGSLTIGVGRNLEAKGITMDEALSMLSHDIKDARFDVDMILDQFGIKKYELNATRIEALVNMAFNMGRKSLSGFVNLFDAIKNYDFDRASVEILDSNYARQVGYRAIEIANQIKTGGYQK